MTKLFLLFLALILAIGLTAFADEPKPKKEKSDMPKGIGYGPKAGKSMKAPGPARATAAKSMARPTRRGK